MMCRFHLLLCCFIGKLVEIKSSAILAKSKDTLAWEVTLSNVYNHSFLHEFKLLLFLK